jgi:type I restriction enzyme R subunit
VVIVRSVAVSEETEWQVRKRRIDPRLDAAGWRLPFPGGAPAPVAHSAAGAHRTEEHETNDGPADYALLDGPDIVAVVEAKRLTVGPQNVLTQAERYAKGLLGLPGAHPHGNGYGVPFIYATNGEVTWFRDVRHPMNRSRKVAGVHTPNALRERLAHDLDAACARLAATPNDNPRLRPYQRDANTAIEAAIADRKRAMLVAMATGTGKTFTTVNQAYRLMKAGVAKRILFLVDRRALAAQAVRAFASYEAEPGKKFNQVYEVYSGRFQKEDFEDDEAFDASVLPTEYLTDPKPGVAFVYIATIQRMAMHVLGRQAIFGAGDEPIDEDADQLDIPIHAFDAIIADECHRGYTGAEESVWRDTLDHFDAIKIGLTATPAAHTLSYFKDKVFDYPYTQAVLDGHLVDYDAVAVRSSVRVNGVFLKEGERVQIVDTETGRVTRDELEDERTFTSSDVEARITAPESNRAILAELKRYTDEHEATHGRFPKTLIFAVHDQPHISHADALVDLARDVFGRGDDFVRKITGRVDRPLREIRKFRNRPEPGVVVTVDLLTTGVDIPDLEFIVLLRAVKSRILFEQILGRGTRKGEKVQKERFVVFDCFEGTLLQYFAESTGLTAEKPVGPTRTIAEIIQAIWDNRDREYNTRCLVKRLHRIDRTMSGKAREDFAAFIPDGDMARYATGLPAALRKVFVQEMTLLRNPDFQALLEGYERAKTPFLVATDIEDDVDSQWIVRGPDGTVYRPPDYLQAFDAFVREHRADVDAIAILLDRPADWSPQALVELNQKLLGHPLRFTRERLQRAIEITHKKALVDVISAVKHAADQSAPLLTASERVERAFVRLTEGRSLTADQAAWLGHIREHLRANLSIEKGDFAEAPVLERAGGYKALRRAFGDDAEQLLRDINGGVAA